jgi:nicotinamidase-related amidase
MAMHSPADALDARRGALVLVDYQSRLMPAIDDAERVLEHGVFLGRLAREVDVPVVGTEENPAGLGHNDPRIASLCASTLAKMSFDACGDGLAERLRASERDIDQVVVAGCEAHVCLLQTSLGLLREGFRVFVGPDACGSRRASDKALAMQRLQQAGAVLVNPEMVAFEWLRSCDHVRFRDVLALVKTLR